jgi:hypothetical protein
MFFGQRHKVFFGETVRALANFRKSAKVVVPQVPMLHESAQGVTLPGWAIFDHSRIFEDTQFKSPPLERIQLLPKRYNRGAHARGLPRRRATLCRVLYSAFSSSNTI